MIKDHLLWPSACQKPLQSPKLAHIQLSYHDNFHDILTACIEYLDKKYLRGTLSSVPISLRWENTLYQ